MMMAEGKTAKEITEGTNMIVEGIPHSSSGA